MRPIYYYWQDQRRRYAIVSSRSPDGAMAVDDFLVGYLKFVDCA